MKKKILLVTLLVLVACVGAQLSLGALKPNNSVPYRPPDLPDFSMCPWCSAEGLANPTDANFVCVYQLGFDWYALGWEVQSNYPSLCRLKVTCHCSSTGSNVTAYQGMPWIDLPCGT